MSKIPGGLWDINKATDLGRALTEALCLAGNPWETTNTGRVLKANGSPILLGWSKERASIKSLRDGVTSAGFEVGPLTGVDGATPDGKDASGTHLRCVGTWGGPSVDFVIFVPHGPIEDEPASVEVSK